VRVVVSVVRMKVGRLMLVLMSRKVVRLLIGSRRLLGIGELVPRQKGRCRYGRRAGHVLTRRRDAHIRVGLAAAGELWRGHGRRRRS
jgi:hypothetical protein